MSSLPIPAAPAAEAPPPRKQPPLLERLGVRYLRSLSAALPPVEAADAVHVLNPEERAALKRVTRGAIFRAFLAGAVSALIAAVGETLLSPIFLGPEPDAATVEQLVWFWVAFGPVVGLAAGLEIAFLYWDGLRSVHRLAHVAGLRLFPVEDDADGHTVAAALARAALELPNPTDSVFGVDPRREASKLKLLVSSLLYKVKVGASNFLAKALVRRLMGRSVVRAYLSFVAIPVTGLWDALVCAKVMREARIRAMGPSAAKELAALVFGGAPAPSSPCRTEILRAVGSSIVRSFDAHPNLVLLLREVRRHVGEPTREVLDDTRAFLAGLAALPPPEQALVLRILCVAAIIDGKLVSSERRLIREALAVCGRPADDAPVRRLRRAFLSGDPITQAELAGL